MIEGWIEAAGMPPGVRGGCATRRCAGVSMGGYGRANYGDRCGDDAAHVARNRALLGATLGLPAPPAWLHQVHGTCVQVIESEKQYSACSETQADACVVRAGICPAAVLTADCLPLLLAAADGSVLAAVHAGWRGLAAGVIEAAVAAMDAPAHTLAVWLGPAIGPDAFEIGPEVRAALLAGDPGGAAAFRRGRDDRWHADLYILARRRLQAVGVQQITGGEHCTFDSPRVFHSHRRDGAASGRMASLVWAER